ncbi:hypothetical protein KKF84_16470, partial [Myxococcota bacterium]|nr:hypothetical protein [Myxococcota bacterium]MBU1536921.1 hypothetical protein [Myxococcota bacterium]
CAGEGPGNTCDALATCANTAGGYSCTCPSGYADTNGNGTLCTDYDECAGEGPGNNCSAYANCTNTVGGFDCECTTPGYSGDGVTCLTDGMVTINTNTATSLSTSVTLYLQEPGNLLTTPGAETGDMSGWTITANGGDGWSTRFEPVFGQRAYVTSFDWDRKQQTVDLVALGYSEADLDFAPEINVREWFRGSFNCADNYDMTIELLDETSSVIDSYATGILTTSCSWDTEGTVFTGYGPGVRFVRFTSGGKDTEWWVGHYGTRMDGASITLGTWEMHFSDDNGATWTEWEPYATTRNWLFDEGAGTKAIQVQYRNADMVVFGPYSDSIELDYCWNNSTCSTTCTNEHNGYSCDGFSAGDISIYAQAAAITETQAATALIYLQEPNNLLVTPGAETGDMSGWTVTANGGNGWSTRYEPVFGQRSYVTSYGWDRKRQTLDLVALGYSTAELDAAPDIATREWFRGSYNCADHYQMTVELLDASNGVIDSYDTGVLTTACSWDMRGIVFSGYGAGVRFIRFTSGGYDTEFWAGHYGTRMDGASVAIGNYEYRLSEDGVNWGTWTPYDSTTTYNLPAGLGERILYVQYRDADTLDILGMASDKVTVQ